PNIRAGLRDRHRYAAPWKLSFAQSRNTISRRSQIAVSATIGALPALSASGKALINAGKLPAAREDRHVEDYSFCRSSGWSHTAFGAGAGAKLACGRQVGHRGRI